MYTLPNQDLAHIWEKAKDCLASIQGGRFFITGGTGFFGLWLLESILYANEYLHADISAVILTRDPNGFFQKAAHLKNAACFEFMTGDVSNFLAI